MASTMQHKDPLRPARRVAEQKQDVWSIVNEAAASSPVQPIVHMGQGSFGYNPPQFVIDAAKHALDQVHCNQYAPSKGHPRLKKALAEAYSPFFGKKLDPDTEITITTGANEGVLCAILAFIEEGDEVIVFEPFFDQYVPNIKMAGGKVKYVPMHPPANGATETTSAAEWSIDMDQLRGAITPRTRMIILNTPHNPVGKIYSRSELETIGALCVENNILILSDEVYDKLAYAPFTRIATISPEVARLTLTIGSAGKTFYATGWRVGWLIGPSNLIKHVLTAHTIICFTSPTPPQEAAAVGFEQAEQHGFWEQSKRETLAKAQRFNEIWPELGLPYSVPEGGYFVLVNMKKVKLPENYEFPSHVAERPRDFKLSWFLCQELGVAAIPPTEFYNPENAHIAEDYLRFSFCKTNEVLDTAKERLRGLKKYIRE